MFQRSLIIIFLLFFVSSAFSQRTIRGEVYDAETREPMPFVNISIVGSSSGTSTNVEGRFQLLIPSSEVMLKLSYIGYEPLSLKVNDSKDYYSIALKKSTLDLMEVEVLPGVNPADVIMEKVYQLAPKNDPERALDFRYETYNKLFFTLGLDSSLILHPEKINELDSSDQRAIKFFERQHLFLTESVTERQHMAPDRDKETILASRVSGFQNPIFTLLATELQSFTLYRSLISLAGVKYEGPVAKNAGERYLFQMADTLVNGADTIWTITFRPWKNKAFKGMKGVLQIENNTFSLVQVTAEPNEVDKNGFNIRINQQYEKVAGNVRFPTQLNTKIDLPMVQLNNFNAAGYSYTYIRNIQINPDLSKKEFSVVEVAEGENINNRDEAFWNTHREDSLSARESRTYEMIDSLSKAEGLEKKVNRLTRILSGKWPVGPIDLELNRILDYNEFEGIRAGLGFSTNNKVSKHFSLGAYGAYGFSDKAFKYGSSLNVWFDKYREYGWKSEISHDVRALAHFEEPFAQRGFNIGAISDLHTVFLNRFETSDRLQSGIFFRSFKYLKTEANFVYEYRKTFENYSYSLPLSAEVDELITEYHHTYLELKGKFHYKEKFIGVPGKLVSKGSAFPPLQFSIQRSLPGVLDGKWDYLKVQLQTEKAHRLGRAGSFYYLLQAGKIWGEVPMGLLMSPMGSFRPLTVLSGHAFETMRTNEFMTDEMAAFFFEYRLPDLRYGKKFNPRPVFCFNYGIGRLADQQRHEGLVFDVPDKGYSEAGIAIHDLIKNGFNGLGVSVHYRLGPYALATPKDNLAFKLALRFNLSE